MKQIDVQRLPTNNMASRVDANGAQYDFYFFWKILSML